MSLTATRRVIPGVAVTVATALALLARILAHGVSHRAVGLPPVSVSPVIGSLASKSSLPSTTNSPGLPPSTTDPNLLASLCPLPPIVHTDELDRTQRYPVRVRLLQAKLHRVRVTHVGLHCEGSCAIDQRLLDRSGIRLFQCLEIYNIDNGACFTTYALHSPPGSGEITLSAAAARMTLVGDPLIICAYADYDASELATHQPIIIILVDDHNRPRG